MDSMCILLHGTTLCSKDSCQSTLHLPVDFLKQTDVDYAILISVTIANFLFFLENYSSIFFHFQEEIELCQTYHLQR